LFKSISNTSVHLEDLGLKILKLKLI
jgi:hypothetical protein